MRVPESGKRGQWRRPGSGTQSCGTLAVVGWPQSPLREASFGRCDCHAGPVVNVEETRGGISPPLCWLSKEREQPLLEAGAGQESGVSAHLCVPLPTAGFLDEVGGPQPQLPTSSGQSGGVVSSGSQETEPQYPQSALADLSLPLAHSAPPCSWGSPQKEQVLPQLRLCSREPQTIMHATPPNRRAGAIIQGNDEVIHTRVQDVTSANILNIHLSPHV